MSTHKQINTRITNDQDNALSRALSASGQAKSEAIREALADYCAKHGINWPSNMPSHGGERNNSNQPHRGIAIRLLIKNNLHCGLNELEQMIKHLIAGERMAIAKIIKAQNDGNISLSSAIDLANAMVNQAQY